MAKKTKVEVNEEVINNEAEESKVETTENADAEIDANEDSTQDAQETTEAEGESSEEQKDKKDLLIEELNDKYMRTFAEFDNFRKRTEKEKTAMFEVGAKSIVEKILPVVDNFERGLATVPDEQKEDPFVQGMDKIYKQLMTTLEEAGVKPIEALNNEFDPELHNAVMQVESDEYESGIIAQELQKGYTYRDSVVRHSMVKVAN